MELIRLKICTYIHKKYKIHYKIEFDINFFSAGNGLMKKDVERVDSYCSNSNNKSKINGCRPKNSNSCCTKSCRSSKLLPPPLPSNTSSATLHRSGSVDLLSHFTKVKCDSWT